jgi:hypothetical protein
MSRPLYIIGIDGRGNYIRPQRLRLPLAIATGSLEQASPLQLRELGKDIAAELELRRAGR